MLGMEVDTMSARQQLALTDTQRQELWQVVKHDAKSYMRERAAALLKIADGASPHHVALHGLLQVRHPDTVYNWLDRYREGGLPGLLIHKGRGRKPAFSPRQATAADAQAAVLAVVRRSPQLFGYSNVRWRLSQILITCDWLRLTTTSGLSQLLQRLGISYKRGRDYVHSPDTNYQLKLDWLLKMRQRTCDAPERFVFVYADQLTYYRQPSLAKAYEQCGPTQPLARRSHTKNTTYRIMGALNAITGQVTYRQRSHTDIACLVDFWYDLRHAYPHAETIYVTVDNWPVLFHPDVLAPLQAQNLPWPPYVPGNWPTTASPQARHDNLPIQLICLPTYASWLNPIEKLWRWLKQDILHLHRLSDDWTALKQAVAAFLDTFASGSTPLLRYVGLLPD
jgi:transposase